MPVFRVVPATKDERVVPWLPSRTSSARGVGEELAVDRVADLPFRSAERFFAGLPFGLFALVVRATGRVVCDLGDRSAAAQYLLARAGFSVDEEAAEEALQALYGDAPTI